jgi:copper/silver efflux system protein
MIERIIESCARNRFLVFVVVAILTIAGIWSSGRIPLDAIPDISDTQVIVYTKWMGQSPDLIEDQITYPIVSALISAPNVRTVRGSSAFNVSYVYVIFEDGTDLYWARSRVLEYIQQVAAQLPDGVQPTLGPDATGVGWVYQYALVDTTGTHDLSELRTLQDWYIRYSLASVDGVAEVASVGGFVREYQVEVDPTRLAAYGLTLRMIIQRIRQSNRDVGGRTIEQSGREYMVRGRGYVKSVEDLELIALTTSTNGVPVYLGDVASVALGPALRRGVAELDGDGEVVGGIVVMRDGENALNVIERVKEKLEQIRLGLPEEVQIIETYDRSELIEASIETLSETLFEEIAVVSVVIVIFLLHFRSALVPIIALPVALIIAFIPMYLFGVTSNIMSLGGLALSIGVVVDASLVMVESAYRKLSESDGTGNRIEMIIASAKQVGRPIFFSLAIIVISFLPVFLLEAQEGRMFRPLALTKTFAMIASSILAITLVPALMIMFVRGKNMRPESRNPVSRFFVKIYRPVLVLALRFPKTALLLNLALIPAVTPLYLSLGSEFMPPLYEGTIMYMPVTVPGISITEATRLLKVQDAILSGFPEVERVFGKVGRAETSTDPAPLSMVETVITLKPKEQWRDGMTYQHLITEMDSAMQFPGVQNAWTLPIRGRIDMLTTGIRTPVGIKIRGSSLDSIARVGQDIEGLLGGVDGTRSVYAERVTGGYFVDIDIDRAEIARYGLTIDDVEIVIQAALGGATVSRTVEGRERYPITVRYSRELRDDIEQIKRILVPLPMAPGMAARMDDVGGHSVLGFDKQVRSRHIPLEQVAQISISSGPGMIRDEDGMLTGYVFVDVTDRDIGGYVDEARELLDTSLDLPIGYLLQWSGQYEFQVRARERLSLLLPMVIVIIFVLLYMTFRSVGEAVMILFAVVYALCGGLILQYLLGYNFSVAVWVGYIALFGVAVETGVVMVVYLLEALERRTVNGTVSADDVREATLEGSALRLRPKLMTVATTMIGLLPIFWSTGVGSDVMKPIAAPIVGGMVTSTIHVLIITPVIFYLVQVWRIRKSESESVGISD